LTIARSFLDQFGLTEWTPSLLVVPNQFGVLNASGLFAESSVSQNTFTFEEMETTYAQITDRIRGERTLQSRDPNRKIRSYPIPHFNLSDAILPQDLQGKRQIGRAHV